jgi:hypothetical protein
VLCVTLQVHLRHLVGGRARSFTGELPDERIFQVRSSFPQDSSHSEPSHWTHRAGACAACCGGAARDKQ